MEKDTLKEEEVNRRLRHNAYFYRCFTEQADGIEQHPARTDNPLQQIDQTHLRELAEEHRSRGMPQTSGAKEDSP